MNTKKTRAFLSTYFRMESTVCALVDPRGKLCNLASLNNYFKKCNDKMMMVYMYVMGSERERESTPKSASTNTHTHK
jgi:hypothetical protein